MKTLIEEGADINKIDKKKLNPYTYALKFHQTQIAQLLHSKGAEETSGKTTNKEKKGKTKKQKSHSENLNVNEEQESVESKPKKYLLVKINSDGTKKALTSEELEELKQKIEAVGVDVMKKDNLQSARLAGFGNTDLAVELFVDERYYGKISPVLEEFRMSL